MSRFVPCPWAPGATFPKRTPSLLHPLILGRGRPSFTPSFTFLPFLHLPLGVLGPKMKAKPPAPHPVRTEIAQCTHTMHTHTQCTHTHTMHTHTHTHTHNAHTHNARTHNAHTHNAHTNFQASLVIKEVENATRSELGGTGRISPIAGEGF